MYEQDDEQYMRLALEIARRGTQWGQTPFGACIVCQGEVIARAHNLVWATTDITAHAEIVALRAANHARGHIHLTGCTVYTTCEPCPMCFSACHWANVDRIVFGASIADAQEAGFRELAIAAQTMAEQGQSPVALTGGVLRDKAVQLFRDWRAQQERRTY